MRRCLFGEFSRSNLAPCTLRVDGTLTIAETVGCGIAAERPIFECREVAASIKPFEFTLLRYKTKKAQLNVKARRHLLSCGWFAGFIVVECKPRLGWQVNLIHFPQHITKTVKTLVT